MEKKREKAMQRISKVKGQKGSISLFVLLALLFFLAVVTSVGTSFRNKEASIDANFNKIKAKYEKDIGNEGQIYQEKLGRHTITFDANGGTLSELTREVKEGTKIGTLPIPEKPKEEDKPGFSFKGWVTEENEQITENTLMGNADVIYYAQWIIDSEEYITPKVAIENVLANGIQTEIKISESVTDQVSIKEGQNILLNLQENTLSNNVNKMNAIYNSGTIEIINGTVESTCDYAAIDNIATGKITLRGTTVTSERSQGIVNKGGEIYIEEGVEVTSKTSFAIENRNVPSAGSIFIRGGIIKTTGNKEAIGNAEGCTLVIGTKDGNVILDSPIIQGKPYGVTLYNNTQGNIYFYDGTVKGTSAGFRNEEKIVEKETGYGIEHSTDIIDDITYKTAYLVDEAQLAENYVAEINGTKYYSLQDAISDNQAVPTDNTQVTIKLLKNTSETITIAAGKNIVFNLQNYTISNNGTNPVIENNGKITIQNGTIYTNTSKGAINNNTTGELVMTGGKIIATGTRQAIWNNGGKVSISGTAYLSAKADVDNNNKRGTIHNLASGTLTITGGTIESTKASTGLAISNAGTMTIGTKDGNVLTNTPIIQGVANGVYSTTNFNYYDGTIKGVSAAINDESKIIDDKETGYELKHETEDTYNIVYWGEIE